MSRRGRIGEALQRAIRGEGGAHLFPGQARPDVMGIPYPLTKEWLWQEYCRIPREVRHKRPYENIADQLEVDYRFLKAVEAKEPVLLAPLIDSYRKTASWNVAVEVKQRLVERGLI